MGYLRIAILAMLCIFNLSFAKSKKHSISKTQAAVSSNQLLCEESTNTLISSMEIVRNEIGAFSENANYFFSDKPQGYFGFSVNYFMDFIANDQEIWSYPYSPQDNDGWFFLMGDTGSVTYRDIEYDWTDGGFNSDVLAGNSYEIRFPEGANGKAFYGHDSEMLIDVPFELWYLGSTIENTSDDVRMIPIIEDIGDQNFEFSFQLDHPASDSEYPDPFSDRLFFYMPLDDSPGQSGYNEFVDDATAGLFSLTSEEPHISYLTIMNLDLHQYESEFDASDGPTDAMPEIRTIFRINFYEQEEEKWYNCKNAVNVNNWEFSLGKDGTWGEDGFGFGIDYSAGSYWNDQFIIYKGGHYIGAVKQGVPSVTVTEFESEFREGAITNENPASLNQLTAKHPDDPSNRVYIIDESKSGTDWDEWPLELGAPSDDSGNPELLSNQDSWTVYNDLDAKWHFDGDPMGLEVQRSTYSFVNSLLADVVFVKWTIENKTTEIYTDAYFGMWCEIDIGDWQNDLAGFDELRNMGYGYNGNMNDAPIAFGIDVLSSPGQASDTAAAFTSIPGYEEPLGDAQRYNILKGLSRGGSVRPNGPYDNNGDPVSGTGEIDDILDDKRFVLSVGPFELNPGDKNEIFVAMIAAMSEFDNLDAITQLRQTSDFVQNYYDAGNFTTPVIENTSAATALFDNDLEIFANIDFDQGVNAPRLYYAQGGSKTYDQVDMSKQGNQYRGLIPKNSVTGSGLSYFIEVENEAGFSSRSDTTYLSVDIPDNTVSASIVGGKKQNAYKMISIPFDLENGSVDNVLSDDLGAYDPTKWRLFKDTGDSYLEYPNAGDFSPGASFWLITKSDNTINFPAGATNPLNQNYKITLKQGWNQIGLPFSFNVAWQDILDASNDPQLNGPYLYEEFYVSPLPTTLEPFKGYYIENLTGSDIELNIPPIAAQGSFEKPVISGNWQLMIKAKCDYAVDNLNIVGVEEDAENGRDRFDISEPPAVGEYLSVYFTHPQSKNPSQKLATDFRKPGEEGYTWHLEMSSNIKDEPIELKFYSGNGVDFQNNLTFLPRNLSVILFNPQTKESFDLRSERRIILNNPSGKYAKMVLIIGSQNYIESNLADNHSLPKNFKLLQNYPNPFNPSTTIEFQLPEAEKVSLSIYNLLGKRIKNLVPGELKDAGYHKVQWSGKDELGADVASGIYIYKIAAGNFVETKKMIMIR